MYRKVVLDDLAIFGGEVAFEKALHVGRPNIGNRGRFEEYVTDILERRWLTNDGKYVKEFERCLAEIAGVKHCIAMCNATVALEIAIRAMELSGEVIIPSYTFIATAHALQWQGITPVFCDIDPTTLNLDPRKVEQMITSRTTGIIGVHVYGRACDIDALSEIAARRGLKLLFDSAHAFGCSYKGQMIGGFGNAEVFSFHATKFLNSLEGGAVVTNDDELASKISAMKNFGFSGYDQTDHVGVNGKMNEISAAMGLTNLESLHDFISTNFRNYDQYRNELAGIQGVSLVAYSDKEKYNYQYIVLKIDEGQVGLNRDQFVQILHAENILARRYFYPGCHQMEPYRSCFPDAALLLPETEKIARQVLCLPTGTSVGQNEIEIICQILRLAIANGSEISKRMETGS